MRGICLTVLAGICSVAYGARFSSQSYVQDGLVTQFDAIENVGVGQHDGAAATWKDLKGSASIAVPAGTAWVDRGFDSQRIELKMANMPAFFLDSVATEVVLDRVENGPAGGYYPRIIHHPGGDGVYSVYLPGSSIVPQFFIDGRGDPRPTFGSFSSGTLGMASDTTNYRVFRNGTQANSSGTVVISHKEAAAGTWLMNRQNGGYLRGCYRAFRHYNRALTATEFAQNAQIDQFRFFSYAVEGNDSETVLPWATAGWQVPYGRSETFPKNDTNGVVRILNAKVSLAASDGVALKGLSLEDGAALVLAADADVCVQTLYLECGPVARGVYTGAEGTRGTVVDWISGAGCVRVAGAGSTKFPTPVRGLGSYSYVQDGLVTQFDAIDNVGMGVHDAEATNWLDLVGTVYLNMNTNVAWEAGRYFNKTGESPIYFANNMPAYVRDSISCEVPICIHESGSGTAGNYPRIFANSESFSIYFMGAGKDALVYLNGQTPDVRPNLGYFRIGTIAALSGPAGYGGAVDGVVKSMTSSPVLKGLNISAGSWGLGHAGKIIGAYGGLRFYNRRLTDEELAWNTLVDKLRFFSYAYANDGTEIAWADVPWGIPEGQADAAPSATTNQYVTLSRAKVGVTSADEIALAGLSLEEGATLAVAEGVIVSTKVLFVNGRAIDHGIYTGAEGTTGVVVSWLSGAGQVRVAGALDRTPPLFFPTPTSDGWYEFGQLNGAANMMYIVGEHPIWDDYAFPKGAKLRLRGYILLETVPDIFADYDTTQLSYAYVNGTRAYAAKRPFLVPNGATFRFLPGTWKAYANNSNVLATVNNSLLGRTTGDVELVGSGSFRTWGDGLGNLTYSGVLSGDGLLSLGSYGRQVRFTGGFACNGSSSTGWQNANGVWIDSLAVTSTLQTVTLSGCGGKWGITKDYSASFLMFGKNDSGETADHPLNINRLNGNASSRFDSEGRRWRSGGHLLVWGANTVHVGALHAGIHVVADRADQDCTNGFLDRQFKSKGIGNLAVDAFNTGTIFGSTNVALTVGTVAAGTAFDYSYQSNGVNRLALDITGTCAAGTTVTATDLAMLPARLSGFAGTVFLTETEARAYEMPIDFTVGPTGLYNTVGCDGSGTLTAAPETGTIDVTFPTTGIEPVPGKYAVVRFTSGGELLKNWTVTLNGVRTAQAAIDRHSVRLCRGAAGIWVGINQPGCVLIFR